MKKTLLVLAAIALVGCADADSKTNNANNINNVNNLNNVNNVNNVNNANNTTTIDPRDYEQSCQWDTECALVNGGDVCGCLDTCASAISSSAVEQFVADAEAIVCESAEPVACTADECVEQMAVCTNDGMCNAIPMVSTFAADYDQSCESVEDCVAVPEGRICRECDCPTAVINIDEFDAYNEARSERGCNPGESDCLCAPPEISCVEGTCQVGR